MSLPTLPKVQKLQDTLHAKAKGSPDYRFYALYDKIYRKDVLWVAYRRCLINGGAGGVDGQTFEEIEAYGETKWLGELAEELREKTYRPSPVRRSGEPVCGRRKRRLSAEGRIASRRCGRNGPGHFGQLCRGGAGRRRFGIWRTHVGHRRGD